MAQTIDVNYWSNGIGDCHVKVSEYTPLSASSTRYEGVTAQASVFCPAN
jgi:hypothetical protein